MAPLTPAFKCFLGGSTGLGGQADRGVLRELFAAAAAAGRMVVAHCEDEDLLAAGRAARPDATAKEHHLVRSSEAEIESVRTAIALARETGAELHVFHVSTGGACALMRQAQTDGTRVSGSTGPQYVQLSCDDAERLGNLLKVNPSIKTPADGAAILAALDDGTLDAIGTDHAPHPLADKLLPYGRAPSGMPSVDLLWPLVYDLVLAGRLDPGIALASVTSRAAATLHLPRKGRIEPGYDGDLVLFDPDERFVVRGAELLSRSKWSAYEGRELPAPPRRVIRRGELVLDDGRVLVEAGGLPLSLEPPSPRS
jgi:dihydroorotase